ncbi:MAG TPA: class I SAM-dependent methyltransferase [Polyangiaceae bacterium]|nr:class I SAM-dependent methyltransferase [Polyangiaceae bacterium]
MDASVKKSMHEYYDVHARDYDRVYAGQFPGSELVGADAYPEDAAALREVIARSAKGALLDVPCGTAFWLSVYAPSVTSAVLIDQSERMLGEARARAHALGVDAKCRFAKVDIVSEPWPAGRFDTLLVGFFLSHADSTDESAFFERARSALAPGGTVIILDSIWNEGRAQSKPKESVVRRSSTDGRSFDVYKRFFDADDMTQMAARYGLVATVAYAGRAFIAAVVTVGSR